MGFGIHAMGLQTRAAARAGSVVRLIATGVALALTLGGCHSINQTVNPALALTESEAREQTRALEIIRPADLERPVLVLGGYRAPHIKATFTENRLARYTSRDRGDFLSISYPTRVRFEAMADRVVRHLEHHFPSDNPDETVEVDVVGLSMGGLVARFAAMPPGEGRHERKRLRIGRLFTIATPHRGAMLAERIRPDGAAASMAPGSEFLARLDDALPGADYEIIPYARLRDSTVGATNAAPLGQEPIWVDGPTSFSHLWASRDERILLDIALRLRGMDPVGSPSTPPRD